MFPSQRDSMVQQIRDEDHEIKRSKEKRRRSRRRFRLLALLVLIGGCIPLALVGWKDLYSGFLETSPPTIEVLELPRGIGLTPVSLRVSIQDPGSGLSDVIIRAEQRGSVKEIYREKLDGKKSKEVEIVFNGDRTVLDEGVAQLEVKVFDRSLWSNRAEISIPLSIDYRRPRVEVVSTQHNARQGGSQLVFYRAFDENLTVSGVKVGGQTFLGFPAKGIDSEMDDRNLFVAIYVTDLEKDTDQMSVKVFAEDIAGNAFSTTFYNRIAKRSLRTVKVDLSERYLREDSSPLADFYYPQLRDQILAQGADFKIDAPIGSSKRLLQQFDFVNRFLVPYSSNQIAGFLKTPRFERYWDGPFQSQPGSLRFGYGDLIRYKFDKEPVGELLSRAFEYSLSRDNRDVIAANGGIVSFVENIGVYGRTVGIDHGLGLVSVYGNLESSTVERGERVLPGTKIGIAAVSGVVTTPNVHFEMRASGVRFDPGEWMDRNWYQGHVVGKINEIRTILGLPVYRRLD